MDLPVIRLRQIVAAIDESRFLRDQQTWQLARWQTRSVCQAVAASAGSDENGKNDLLDWANSLGSDFSDEQDETPEFDVDDLARALGGI